MRQIRKRLAVAILVLAALPAMAIAQDRTTLTTDREKLSYMVGMDVARGLAPLLPDVDQAAFEKALRNTLDGGQPLLQPEQLRSVGEALGQRAAARDGRPLPGGQTPPQVDKTQAGYLLGADVGRSLLGLKNDIDLAVLMQALRTVQADGKPLLSEAQANEVRNALVQRLQAKAQDAAKTNQAEGEAFLAQNKTVKGVFSTPSGLQYTVLQQGKGARPKPSDRVRVHYRGTLLDGKVFDSSYDRGEPAEFALNQVIAGWTEGVALMPVGAKYKFWVPAQLGYGPRGTPDGAIGPNATLVFEVELLDILP